MIDTLSQLWSRLTTTEVKSSRFSRLISGYGAPVWTPRRYDTLTAEGYHKNVIVYRCVTLIAQSVGSVPFLVYDGPQESSQHSLLKLLNCPNPLQAGSAFIESVVSYLLLSGNAYIESVADSGGEPTELHSLRPDRIRIIPSEDGLPAGYEYSVNGQRQMIPARDGNDHAPILHLKRFHPLNDWYGLSPLEVAAQAIDQHNAVAGHNLSLLQNGGRPSGGLIIRPTPHGRGLTDEQRQSLRQDLRDIYAGGKNAGQMLILEGDCDWREMGLSPKDLDFIEGKNVSAREIAQAFGVPPMLVGVPGDATFANYKEARFHLWEDTIIPLLEFLVAELNLWLATRWSPRLQICYDVDAIPALTTRREAQWAKVAQADFLTLNEKRQAVGYEPLPDGDRLC